MRTDGTNALPGNSPNSMLAMVRSVLACCAHVFDAFSRRGIYRMLGDRAEAWFLLGFVFILIGITLVQERKTQRALEALRDLAG